MMLVNATSTTVTTHGYNPWGVVTVNTEAFANGWHNPYLYDGRDGVRYDTETNLYWMSVRAYDPTLGRFISRDPLGRVPLMGWTTQPYAYAGNNPLLNVDPSGQRLATESAAEAKAAMQYQRRVMARVYPAHVVRLPAPPPPSVRMINPVEFLQVCGSVSHHPGWCGRYLTYWGGIPTPNWGGVQHADYYWFLGSVGSWRGGQAAWYYIPQTKQWLMSVGGYVGLAVGYPLGFLVAEAGFGMLLTNGNPNASQINAFLRRFTGMVTSSLGFGISLVGSPGVGWALQYQVASGFDLSVSGSWTWEPGPIPPDCYQRVFPPLPPDPSCPA